MNVHLYKYKQGINNFPATVLSFKYPHIFYIATHLFAKLLGAEGGKFLQTEFHTKKIWKIMQDAEQGYCAFLS